MTRFADAQLQNSSGFQFQSASVKSYTVGEEVANTLVVPYHCFKDHNVKKYVPQPKINGNTLTGILTGNVNVTGANFDTGEVFAVYAPVSSTILRKYYLNGTWIEDETEGITEEQSAGVAATISGPSSLVHIGTAPNRTAQSTYIFNGFGRTLTIVVSANENNGSPTYTGSTVTMSASYLASKMINFKPLGNGYNYINVSAGLSGTPSGLIQYVAADIYDYRGSRAVTSLADFTALRSVGSANGVLI